MLKHFLINFINIGAGLPGHGGEGWAADPSTEHIDNNFTGRVTQAGRGRSINDPPGDLKPFCCFAPFRRESNSDDFIWRFAKSAFDFFGFLCSSALMDS